MGKKGKRKRSVGLPSVLQKTAASAGVTMPLNMLSNQLATLNGGGMPEGGDEDEAGIGAVRPSSDYAGCKHLQNWINVDKVRVQLSKGALSQCHDCVGKVRSPIQKEKKGKGKVVKKKGGCQSPPEGSGHKLWVCLFCGQIGCGAILCANQLSQQSDDKDDGEKMEAPSIKRIGVSHAWQHSRQWDHPLVMQCGDNLACCCLVCKVAVSYSANGREENSHETDGTVPSEAGEATPSKLQLLQQVANLVQEKLSAETGNFKTEASVGEGASESKPDETTDMSSTLAAEVAFEPVKSRRVIRGLMNLGNTCFFNSVMQNLLGVDLLREHFSVEAPVREGPLTAALRKFYQEIDPLPLDKSDELADSAGQAAHDPTVLSGLRRSTRSRSFGGNIGSAYTPRGLFGAISMKAPRFKGFQQQDSHELLRCLLDGLHTEEESLRKGTSSGRSGGLSQLAMVGEPDALLRDKAGGNLQDGLKDKAGVEIEKKKPETFVEQVFGGQLASTVSSCECEHSSVVYEPFLDLSLPIPSKQPGKKGISRREQVPLSVSAMRSQRGQALGKGAKGLDAPEKVKTVNGVTDTLNSWGSGGEETQYPSPAVICLPYGPMDRIANSSYEHNDDSDDNGWIKAHTIDPAPSKSGSGNGTEDHTSQASLSSVICVTADSNRNSSNVQEDDLQPVDEAEGSWMDFIDSNAELGSDEPTELLVLGGLSSSPGETCPVTSLSSPIAEAEPTEAQSIDCSKNGLTVVEIEPNMEQTVGNFQGIDYSMLAESYGSAGEGCGLNGTESWASVAEEEVVYGPSPCPTNETNIWIREGEEDQHHTMTSRPSSLLLGDLRGYDKLPVMEKGLNGASIRGKCLEGDVSAKELHSDGTSSGIGRNINPKDKSATSVKSENNLPDFGIGDLFEEGSSAEGKEASVFTAREVGGMRREASGSLMHMDGSDNYLELKTSASNRGKREEFIFTSNGGGLGLREEDDGEEGMFSTMSLEGCLLDFTGAELLSGDNGWECEKCSRQLQDKMAGSNQADLLLLGVDSTSQESVLNAQHQPTNKSLADESGGADLIVTSEVLDHHKGDMQIVMEKLPEISGGMWPCNSAIGLEKAFGSGMNLSTRNLGEDISDGKANECSRRKSSKGEIASCSTPSQATVSAGGKDGKPRGDAKAGSSKSKGNGRKENALCKAVTNDWEDLADGVTVRNSSATSLIDSGQTTGCQPPAEEILPDCEAEATGVKNRGDGIGSRNGGAGEQVHDSWELVEVPLTSENASAEDAREGCCLVQPDDEKSKVKKAADDAIGLVLGYRQERASKRELLLKDENNGMPTQVGRAVRNSSELTEREKHSEKATSLAMVPTLTAPTVESISNGIRLENTLKSDTDAVVPSIPNNVDQLERTNLHPRGGVPFLSGDFTTANGARSKSQKAERSRSRKGGEEPSKVTVKRDATKRFLISKAPPILTVHLKRFAQDMRGRLSKLSGHVAFQEWLDLSPFMDQRNCVQENCKYRLIGTVEHSGTMRGGHYVAYVRGPVANDEEDAGPGAPTWYYISDSHVRQTSLESVLQCEAYLLFYEKCRLK